MGLTPRSEAEVLLEVEMAETGEDATMLGPEFLGESSWWHLLLWILMCEPDFPSSLGVSLEALLVGGAMDF